jgi:hypothetical protein
MLLDSAHIAALALDIIEEHFGDVVQVPSNQLLLLMQTSLWYTKSAIPPVQQPRS